MKLKSSRRAFFPARRAGHPSALTSFTRMPVCKKAGKEHPLPPEKLFSYLTAPVIPSAKLFCKQKKIITVGKVQNSTASISTP